MSVRTSVLGIVFQNHIRNLHLHHPLTCKLWWHKIGTSSPKKHLKKFFPVRPSTELSLKGLSATLNFCFRRSLLTEKLAKVATDFPYVLATSGKGYTCPPRFSISRLYPMRGLVFLEFRIEIPWVYPSISQASIPHFGFYCTIFAA